MAVGSTCQGLFRVLLITILTKHLGPAHYGLWAILLATVEILMPATVFLSVAALPLLDLLTTAEFAERSAPLVPFIAVGALLLGVAAMSRNLLGLVHRSTLAMAIYVVAGAGAVPVCLLAHAGLVGLLGGALSFGGIFVALMFALGAVRLDELRRLRDALLERRQADPGA